MYYQILQLHNYFVFNCVDYGLEFRKHDYHNVYNIFQLLLDCAIYGYLYCSEHDKVVEKNLKQYYSKVVIYLNNEY
jgi:hypothetical protein